MQLFECKQGSHGATELFGIPAQTARHATKEKGLVNRGAGGRAGAANPLGFIEPG